MAAALLVLAVELPVCPARNLFGIPCPGCGLTRATLAILHLDLVEALRFHPLAPIVSPLAAWMLFRMSLVQWGVLRPERWDPFRLPSAFWLGLLVLAVGIWALRLFFGWHPDPVGLEHGIMTTLL